MSKLRDQMQVDLNLKGFSPSTKEAYIEHVMKFAKYYGKCPTLLGEEEIKQYLNHLITKKKTSHSYVNLAYSSLKFLYGTTLKREWNVKSIPRTKTEKKLPKILSPEEVKSIFDVTANLKHKALLVTTYVSGLRVSETANLKIDEYRQKTNLPLYQLRAMRDIEL